MSDGDRCTETHASGARCGRPAGHDGDHFAMPPIRPLSLREWATYQEKFLAVEVDRDRLRADNDQLREENRRLAKLGPLLARALALIPGTPFEGMGLEDLEAAVVNRDPREVGASTQPAGAAAAPSVPAGGAERSVSAGPAEGLTMLSALEEARHILVRGLFTPSARPQTESSAQHAMPNAPGDAASAPSPGADGVFCSCCGEMVRDCRDRRRKEGRP